MARLTILIEPKKMIEDPLPTVPSVEITYVRDLPVVSESETKQSGYTKRIFLLTRKMETKFELHDYVPSTSVQINIIDPQGASIIKYKDLQTTEINEDESHFTVSQILENKEVDRIRKALTPINPETSLVMPRKGQFVVTGGKLPDFRDYTFKVCPVVEEQFLEGKLNQTFNINEFQTIIKRFVGEEQELLINLQSNPLFSIQLTLQGKFNFSLPIIGNEVGWLWLLTGTTVFAGLQKETDLEIVKNTTILLNLSEDDIAGEASNSISECQDCTDSNHRPIDATEDELINNPGLFSDDPGTYCKPFQNPNRIIGERTFHTILRVTQPEIGGDPSVPPPNKRYPFPFVEELTTPTTVVNPNISSGSNPNPTDTDPLLTRMRSVTGITETISVPDHNQPVSRLNSRIFNEERRKYILANSKGREILNRDTFLDYEGDSSIYQATSMAFGHILEFRVRWRSNGYSLGNVAHTLTLAPRQAKKILTVESKIRDEIRRTEITKATERLTQETERSYGYSDAVKSHLSEWSHGESFSSTTGAAGGFGFATLGFVIGGGASHGESNSTSSQQGGRNVSASEEQSLRDSIRQYGESLRKLESMVVVEETQEELVQATSEVIRNPNYGHTLTVIYHEILRHLRVDTEAVGARECVFVPFAIRPFTLDRLIRWRDIIDHNLKKRKLRWVMPYLNDIKDNFSHNSIPEGKRYTHPIKYLSGSLYIQLAIERPKDNEDGSLNETEWERVIKYSKDPFRKTHAILFGLDEREKDSIYQKDFAPNIAAEWVDNLHLKINNSRALDNADFTLASKYQFNRTLKVDFTCTPSGTLTREELRNINVQIPEDAPLPPKSVAIVKRIEIHYQTDTFDRRISSPNISDDLIKIEDGTPEESGASLFLKLSEWERQDLRSIIRKSANNLITHLNEHVEDYNNLIIWNLNRDKLHMMLDSIYVLNEEDGRSVASVVEREPLAIMGNCLVYRVAAGAFLGVRGQENPDALNNYYRDKTQKSDPIRISLPTSGLYAQAVMDDCEALEEHFGSTEWILSDKEPELAELDISALQSRRVQSSDASPTEFPSSIINLQNVPNMPSPSGFSDILNAVQNSEAFKDMAGLEGTQGNARAAMETAANLANQFGSKAVDLKKSEIAAKIAKDKLSVIEKAYQKGAINDDERKQRIKQSLDQMNKDGNNPISIDDFRKLPEDREIDFTTSKGENLKISKSLPNQAKFYPASVTSLNSLQLKWPTEWEGDPNFLTETFLEAINKRSSFQFGFNNDPILTQKVAKDVLEKYLPSYVEALDTDHGKKGIAKTILSIGLIIASDVSSELKSYVPKNLNIDFSPQSTICIPQSARYLANIFGRLIAWVDLATKIKATDDVERIKMIEEEWEQMAFMANTLVGEAVGSAVPIPFTGIILGAIVDTCKPNFDSQLEDIKNEMMKFRQSIKEISKEIFGKVLTNTIYSKEDVYLYDEAINEYIGRYSDWVLGGWDAELTILESRGIEI